MRYSYGHKETAYNGVLIWLQGFRNGKQQGFNHVRGMDWNQTLSHVKKIMVAFLSQKGVNTKGHNEDWCAKEIQKCFPEFVKYADTLITQLNKTESI